MSTVDTLGFQLDEPGREDPTKTTEIQRTLARHLRGYIEDLNSDIRSLLVDEDALNTGRWGRLNDAQTARAFDRWLRETVEEDVLSQVDSDPRVRNLLRKAAERGVKQAHADLRQAARQPIDDGGVSQEELEAIDAQLQDPERRVAMPDIQEDLDFRQENLRQRVEGNLDDFAGDARAIVTAGLAAQVGKTVIARDTVERAQVAKSNVTASATAEIVNEFNTREIGEWDEVKADLEIGVEADYEDAGDDNVCDTCLELSGRDWTFEEAKAFDIPGDTHPFCRCRFKVTQIGEVF